MPFGIDLRPKAVTREVSYTLVVYYRPKCWGPGEFLESDRVTEREGLPELSPARITATVWEMIADRGWCSVQHAARDYKVTEVRYYKTTVKLLKVLGQAGDFR